MLNRLRPLVRLGRYGASTASGLVEKALRSSSGPKAGMDDKTLQNKVETEIFRQPDVAKGKINVNVVEGVVHLRGEARTPEQINALEAAAAAIPEVRGVENVLHLPKTPARTRADAPRRQQKQTTGQSPDRESRTTRRRVSADKTTGKGEKTPDELAAKRQGRPPAKLGTEDS